MGVGGSSASDLVLADAVVVVWRAGVACCDKTLDACVGFARV